MATARPNQAVGTRSRRQLTCSTMMAQLVLAFFRRSGHAVDDLLAAAGLSAAELADVDARIPLTSLLRLWEEAGRRSGDAHIGLKVAQAPSSGIISVIEIAGSCSPNLGELWRRVIRFQHLAIDGAGLRLEEDGGSVFLRFRPPSEVRDIMPRYVPEFALASCLIGARRALGAQPTLRAVRFTMPKPAHAVPYQELFGVPAQFEQPVSELELDPALLQLPLRGGDPAMAAVMERYAQEWLARLDVHENFVEKVQHHIYTELRSGVPSAALIARRLHLSERSFSRRLQQEGASFPKLVDSVRKDLAAVYLGKRSMKLTEVAFLLGFSEISAFYRAHRRWTGMTPAQARGGPAA